MRVPPVNPFFDVASATRSAVRRIVDRYRWMNAQIWRIAKTDSPDEPKPPNDPPKIRCC
jgi:hypothetical protein